MTATPREPTREEVEASLMFADTIQPPEAYIKVLAAAYRALLAQQQWQPIEALPRPCNKVKILGLYPNGNIYVVWWSNIRQDWVTYEDQLGQPTHWRPLPPPPEEKGG